MNKLEKAAEYLNSKGFEALSMMNRVSVLMLNEDLTKRHWVDITSEKIDYYAELYDDEYGGYVMLKDMVAWADRQRESDIISLSLQELIEAYNKAMKDYKIIKDAL